MSEFREALSDVAARLPETRMLVIMGTDGIPVERYVSEEDAHLDAVAAEYTTTLRTSLSTSEDTGLGELLEVTVVNEKVTALMVAITPDYYLFAALAPGAAVGRARFLLRLASLKLEPEFA